MEWLPFAVWKKLNKDTVFLIREENENDGYGKLLRAYMVFITRRDNKWVLTMAAVSRTIRN